MAIQKKETKLPPMMKQYKNVTEMATDLSEDKASGERVAKAIRERAMVDMLMALRTRENMSQTDIAERMGCTQSKVSKLESSIDDDLRLGDFRAYATALGFQMTVRLVKGTP